MNYVYEQVRAFLNPSSIALIGASEDTESISGRATRYAYDMGFHGPIFPVNPRRSRIFGSPSYADIEAIPLSVELAVILRPYQEVLGIVQACGRKRVPFVIVAASGFGETGREGHLRQQELHQFLKRSATRILGPNCMGYINVHGKVCTTFSPVMELPLHPGGVGIVSQSGAMAGSIMNRLQDANIGISHLVSTGNELDFGIDEFIRYFIDDDKTRVIVTYLEGVREGRAFLSVAQKAREAGKPLVVMSAGTSSIGKSVAASHTGSISARWDILKGALNQRRALLCNDVEELVGTVSLLSGGIPLTGDGIGIIATSGGAAAMFADKAEEMNLRLPRFTHRTSQRLSSLLKFGTAQNPLDLTGQVVTDDSSFFDETVKLVLEDENVHLLVLLITQIRGLSGQTLFRAVAEQASKGVKPVVAVWVSGSMVEDSIQLLRETKRIMIFRSFGECARALKGVLKYESYSRAHKQEILLNKNGGQTEGEAE